MAGPYVSQSGIYLPLAIGDDVSLGLVFDLDLVRVFPSYDRETDRRSVSAVRQTFLSSSIPGSRLEKMRHSGRLLIPLRFIPAAC